MKTKAFRRNGDHDGQQRDVRWPVYHGDSRRADSGRIGPCDNPVSQPIEWVHHLYTDDLFRRAVGEFSE